MNKLWGLIKRHKIVTSILFTAVMVTAVLGVQITPTKTLNKSSVSIGQIGQKYEITIGSGIDASQSTDYTATGTAAQQTNTFQIALNALPTTGGILTILSGTYTLNASLTRAIPNVTIEGIGNSTIFSDNGSTPIFAAGTGWNFQNLVLDAGGISGTFTGYNITIGIQYYAVYGATGRTAYLITGSNASSLDKSQADATCTGTNDDTTIQTYINLVQSTGFGSLKFIGTFNCSGSLTFTPLNLSAGMSVDATAAKFVYTGSSKFIIINPNTQSTYPYTLSQNSITWTGGYYYGNGTTSTDCFYIKGLSYSSFRGMTFDNWQNVTDYNACIHLVSDGVNCWSEGNEYANINSNMDCGNFMSWEALSISSSFDDNIYKNLVFNLGVDNAIGMHFHSNACPFRCHFDTITGHAGGSHSNDAMWGMNGAIFSGSVFTNLAGESDNTALSLGFMWHEGAADIIEINGLYLIWAGNFAWTFGGSGVFVVHGSGYYGSGSVWSKNYTTTLSGVLTAGNANGIAFAWENPVTDSDTLTGINIKKVTIEVTTGGGTVGSTLQVGIADSATGTNLGSEFFSGLLLNNAKINDSWLASDTGTQTKWVTCAPQNTGFPPFNVGTKSFIVGKILTQNAASLVGRYYIEFTEK